MTNDLEPDGTLAGSTKLSMLENVCDAVCVCGVPQPAMLGSAILNRSSELPYLYGRVGQWLSRTRELL